MNNKDRNDTSILDLALQMQREHGWINEEGIRALANLKGMPASQVFETLSFYSMIRLKEPSKVRIEVCRGTSCYITRWAAVLEEIRDITKAEIGQDSQDGMFHTEYVECLGHCETAPNVVVNGKLYTSVTPESIRDILKEVAC